MSPKSFRFRPAGLSLRIRLAFVFLPLPGPTFQNPDSAPNPDLASAKAMALTKADILAALSTVRIPVGISAAKPTTSSPTPAEGTGTGDPVTLGVFQWAAVCDTFVSLKFQLHQTASVQERDSLTQAATRAVRARAQSPADGQPVVIDSLIIEYVDDGGNVLHAERSNAGSPASHAAIPQKTSSAQKTGSGPGDQEENAGQPAGQSPPARQSPPAAADGHRPIRIGGGPPPGAPATPQATAGTLAGVKHIIAVGAGKGGVGKSTVAINLAVGLARRGHAVGAMDGDIYGPSFPTMLGLGSLDQNVHAGRLQPFAVHGIKAITIGKLVADDKPLIWRGPMAHGAFKQLSDQTEWGELDELIIDLPPGTGDVSLTMAQNLQLTGAVVVCTPQKVAQDDAVRAARMFQQLGIEVLGVVENMSYFVGDDGKEYDIFGRGGAQTMAQRLGVPFLGAIPITMSLRQNSDLGDPSANFTGTSESDRILTRALEELVTNVQSQIALASMRRGQTRPTLTIS